MSIDPETVLRDAVALPMDRRTEVATELLTGLDEAVLDGPDAVPAAWADELEHRARRALSGEDPGEPWPELRDRIRSKLRRSRRSPAPLVAPRTER